MATEQKRRDEYQDKNTQYLKRVWSEVDDKIDLPPSLTGRALLSKLDGIDPPAQKREIRFSPKLFTWQSGITYAAAFVLIVALSTFLGRGDYASSIEEGYIAVDDADMPFERGVNAFGDIFSADLDEQENAVDAPAENVAHDDDAPMDAPAAAGADMQQAPIGGQSGSTVLGQDESYTYTYRKNDPTDPDKSGYPLTVNVMETETGELSYSIDVSSMSEISKYDTADGALVLIGTTQEGVAVSAYSVSETGASTAETAAAASQGALLDARVYDNVVHVLTWVESTDGLDCETEELTGANADTACVVTALDLETGETTQKAFVGAGTDATLYNLFAYLNYSGEPGESSESGNYIAQIRLDGTSIELMASPSSEE